MTKNSKLELYVLDGCKKCAAIKVALDLEKIEYTEHNCTSSENQDCDAIEDSINCGRYPIAVIKNNRGTTIVYTCEDQKTRGGKIKKVPVDSQDMFISEIKNAYI